MIVRPPPPLRRSLITLDDRPYHSEVAHQKTSLQMWSGVPRYAAQNFETNVMKLEIEDRSIGKRS
jgi:hypothetical protein